MGLSLIPGQDPTPSSSAMRSSKDVVGLDYLLFVFSRINLGISKDIQVNKKKKKSCYLSSTLLSRRTFINPNKEKRVLEKSRSLLNWLTQGNFDKIKNEIVQTIRASPSTFVIKSIVCCIFDMAMVDSASYVLFARLSVELFHALPPFEMLFFSKCQLELQNEDSNCWKFIKTVRVLAMLNETTRQTIIQGAEYENKYNGEVKLRKEAEEALARKTDELELMQRLVESYKKEQDSFQSQAQALEQKHGDELRLRKETEYALAVERERVDMLNLQLQTLINEVDTICLKSEELESKYKGEESLRKATETALFKERKELEEMKLQLDTCITEQENLTSQVRTWQDKYEQESRLGKETEEALSREKQELHIVKGLLEFYDREADAIREERDEARKLVQDLKTKLTQEREPPASFICPITQEVMKDPHFAADGFTYEAEAIKTWLSRGHDTSPMTNLKLPHRNLVPNRALRSAIQELV